MKSLNPIPSNAVALAATAEEEVLKACHLALTAECDYTRKAVTAGALLLDFRKNLSPFSHSGKTGQFQEKPEEKSFVSWLEKNGFARSTAYRWMDAAERVSRFQLGYRAADIWNGCIDIDATTTMTIGQALLLPESELPTAALEFRQGLFDFMSDKTLNEAVRAALDGESPASRITRAAGGKKTGGSHGEDRKAWHQYVAKKFSDAGKHLEHWKSFSTAQKESTLESLSLTIQKWPTAVLEHLAKEAKANLQKR